MRFGTRIMLAATAASLAAAGVAPALAALVQKKTPYFASISASKARMRTGPGKAYPASWLYQRADLPVKVIDVYDRGIWKKIEDPSGTQGWMLGSLVSDTRTGLVMGTIAELRDAPRYGGKVVWRVEPGVVGRLSKCARGWCHFDVRGRGGYVEANRLWGVAVDEALS
jgi:SH3-like domain-containing protein